MKSERTLMPMENADDWFRFCVQSRLDFAFAREGVKRYEADPERYERLGWRRLADDVEADRCAARLAKAKG
ncbi:MAG: hypothetical protein HS116_21215 [Planctomycetes bacterium]|nr:hypothetical protein [Planctomycetota bacterium]